MFTVLTSKPVRRGCCQDQLTIVRVQKCHLHSTSPKGGAFTAQKRLSESNHTGYSFVGCKLTGVGVGTSILGRPWGPYSRVVFALTYMSAAVSPRGWEDWNHHAR